MAFAVKQNVVYLHKVKVGNDDTYDIRTTWTIDEIRCVDGISESPVCSTAVASARRELGTGTHPLCTREVVRGMQWCVEGSMARHRKTLQGTSRFTGVPYMPTLPSV